MELQNNNLTLTTASAWRMALSLTLTDVCRVARQVYEVCKVILAFVYLITSIIFILSESEEGITLNLVGIAMLIVAYLINASHEPSK